MMRRFSIRPINPALLAVRFLSNSASLFYDKTQKFSMNRNTTFLNTTFFYDRCPYDIRYQAGKLIIAGRDITGQLPDNIQRADYFDLVLGKNKMLLNGVDITELAIDLTIGVDHLPVLRR